MYWIYMGLALAVLCGFGTDANMPRAAVIVGIVCLANIADLKRRDVNG